MENDGSLGLPHFLASIYTSSIWQANQCYVDIKKSVTQYFKGTEIIIAVQKCTWQLSTAYRLNSMSLTFAMQSVGWLHENQGMKYRFHSHVRVVKPFTTGLVFNFC